MKTIFLFFLILCGALNANLVKKDPIAGTKNKTKYKSGIYGGLDGRLGNQFFQVAAALSLGIDHNVPVYFPEFRESGLRNVTENGKKVFFRLDFSKPIPVSEIYHEDPSLIYKPIPYKAGIFLKGFFQSEKFFKHNWDKIAPYFEPSSAVSIYLTKKYKDLIDHPFTVAIHVRNYKGEKPENADVYESLTRDYYDQAMDIFDDEALFIIFSDDLNYAKNLFEGLNRPHIYIEKNEYIHDFFLMSMMKHAIIANSSFSWWAAYLNKNPAKVIIAPKKWFRPTFHAKSDDIVPNNWFTL